uniref:Uncharacterized protein n=1 Tax=Solanum tuberosum TaxID=4113 RepID=M1D8A5_SOLTU
MAGINEENSPFVRFPSRERYHDHQNTKFYCEQGFYLLNFEEKAPAFHGVDILLNAITINEALEVSEVLNAEYEAKLREMDLGWLRETLIEPARRDQEDPPVGQSHRCDISSDLGSGVRYTGYRAKCGGINHLRMEDVLYRGNKTAFFLAGLVTSLCKLAGVPLLDTDEAAADADDEGGEDGAGDDTLPTRSQPPLSDAQVEEDLAAVQRRLGCSFANPTLLPPNTALEVELLHRQLRQKRRNGLVRDRLMTRMWKIIKVIFSCVSPDREIPRLEPEDYVEFPMLNEEWSGMIPPEDLDSNDDTSQSQRS